VFIWLGRQPRAAAKRPAGGSRLISLDDRVAQATLAVSSTVAKAAHACPLHCEPKLPVTLRSLRVTDGRSAQTVRVTQSWAI